MDNAFSRLSKVIALERKQGYRNKAVIGGLDKFASRWEADARAEAPDHAAVNEIVALLIGYPSVTDQNARERIVDQIVRRLKEVSPVAANLSEVAPTGEPAPAASKERTPAEPKAGPTPSRPAPPAERTSEERETRGPVEAEATTRRPAAEAGREDMPERGSVARPKADYPGPEPAAPAERVPSRIMPGRSKPEPPAPSSPAAEANGGAAPAAQPTRPEAPPTTRPAHERRPAPPAREPGPVGEPAKTAAEPEAIRPPAVVGEGRPVEGRPVEGRPAEGRPIEGRPIEGRPIEGRPGEGQRDVQAAEMRDAALGQAGRGLDAPVTKLPSVGPSYAEKLSKLGVETIRDLLFLLPRRYDDFSLLRTIDKLRYGEEVTIIGTIWDINSRTIGEGRRVVNAIVGDGTGEMQMSWFNPFVERQLHIGQPFVFSGKIDSYRGRFVMSGPEFEPLDRELIHTGRLVPVYPLTSGITGRWLRGVIKRAVDTWAAGLGDFLPERVRVENGLLLRAAALGQIHFPDSQDALAAAHRRLSFDEFFVLQLGVLGQRQELRGFPARSLCADEALLAPFLANLPFQMTAAQQRALAEIARDLAGSQPMSRLLQGDVGSGKTAVAAAGLWAAVANGSQGAIMAPTEILAEQHARSLQRLFAGLTHPSAGREVRIALLTGSARKAERDEILAGLAQGEIDIAVGTHALIQEDVLFHDLAFAVVDEQHRFGVGQRAALRQKGTQPHLLVMSATPIPRSLALTIYGDLDVTVIDEMPAGRTPVKTKWLASTQRERAYDFIRRQVKSGRQAFIIYPLVENSERGDAKAAVEEHTRLQTTVFPELRLGLLHGRLKSEEKDAVMRAFSAGELDVLVATSVVEVGIDVPNATVIVIEGAERFGLAQMHQFRGRVGRGECQSYCILISDTAAGDSAQRLQALETSNDGFALAQIDLEMRGPGDFFGTRQSGLPMLQMAQLSDLRTLEDARNAAQQLFAEDPQLARPEHRALAVEVAAFWRKAGDAS